MTKLCALPPPGVKDEDGLRQPMWQLKTKTGEPLAFKNQVSYKTTAGFSRDPEVGRNQGQGAGKLQREELRGDRPFQKGHMQAAH